MSDSQGEPSYPTAVPTVGDTGAAQSDVGSEWTAGWQRALSSPLLLPAILLFALALYAPTLDDWFSGDDFWFLRSSQATPVGEYAARAFDFRETGTLPEFDRYRPLYPVVWRLSYAVFGLHAWGYHAVVLALHLGSAALVWFIALRLTRLTWAAGLATLVFAVHPAYADAIAWVSGGNRVLATFPYLLSLLLYMRYLDGGDRKGAYYGGSFLAFLVAILLHPTTLTLAAVLPAYAFLVAGTPAESLRPRSWVQFAPFAVVTAALLGIQTWTRTHLGIEEQFRFGWHQYSNYGNYLGMALLPVFPLNTDWVSDPLTRILEGIEGVASVAMILLSVALLVRRERPYLGAFVVGWLFVSLLPDSTLLFTTMGRVLYLPGAALAILLAVAALWLRDTLSPRLLRVGAYATPLLIVVALALTAVLTAHHADRHAQNAADNEAFLAKLQEGVPSMDAGGVLYVVNAPTNIIVFDDTRVDALVELYYGEVEVRRLQPIEVAEVAASLGEKDRIFQFQR